MRIISWFSCAAVATCLLFGCYNIASAQSPTSSEMIYKQGFDYYQAKKYQKAIDLFSATIDDPLDQRHVYAFYYIGLCYHELKNYAEAEKNFSNAMLIDKTRPEIMYARSINDCFRGNYMHAWLNAMAAIGLDSTKAEYWDLVAIGALGQDWKLEEAAKAYTHAISLDPQAVYYYKRGKVYGEMGNYELSKPDFEKARSLDPNVEKAFDNPKNPFNSQTADALLKIAPLVTDAGDVIVTFDGKGKVTVADKPKAKEKKLTTILGFQTENKMEYAVEYRFKYHYTFAEAVKACPSGYRMPTAADWENLVKHIATDKGYEARNYNNFIYHIGIGWKRTFFEEKPLKTQKHTFESENTYDLNISPMGIYTGFTTSLSEYELPTATGYWIEPFYRNGSDLNAVVIDADGMRFAWFDDKAKLCVRYILK